MGQIFEFPYRTVLEISLPALVKNLVTLRTQAMVEVLPVVKADAYGHGMLPVSKVLLGRGSCQMLAVATLEEAINLRKAFDRSFGILVLSGYLPHQIDAYIRYNLTPVIHSVYHTRSLVGVKHLPSFHLKIDTGMNRLGVKKEERSEVISILKKLPDKLSGVATHFSESENQVSDSIDQQIKEFEEWVSELRREDLLQTDARIHAGNSGAILRKKLSLCNAVRPGLSLYGISPSLFLESNPPLVPILNWKTRILSFKDIKAGETVGYGRTYQAKKNERLAILPVGYADGYPRNLSNRGEVAIGERRLPVRGRVSMDLIAVDVTGVDDLREGTSVTLIGNNGKGSISAWEFANWAETIPYEIFCGISSRVPRIYFDAESI